MEFTVGKYRAGRSRYIAVYPVGMRGFSVAISRYEDAECEPEMTMRQVESEEALFDLLVTEGVPEEEIRDCFCAEPPRTRTILAASVVSVLFWLLIGTTLSLWMDWL